MKLPLSTRSILAAGLVTLLGIGSSRAAITNVTASGVTFVPSVITINAGDSVVWNGLVGFHSVTGDTPPETLCGNSFPSTCSNKFDTPGAFSYHCINHVGFGMTGLVQVVAAPVAIQLSAPQVTNGQFTFRHPATPGTRYVIESTANFTNWSALATNTAASNNVTASDIFQVGGLRFYRVGQLPDP